MTKSPEEVIRDYLEEHDGAVAVSVAALGKTWELEELTPEDRERIADRLADVGVLIDPPFEEAAEGDDVTVYLADEEEWQELPPTEQADAAVAPEVPPTEALPQDEPPAQEAPTAEASPEERQLVQREPLLRRPRLGKRERPEARDGAVRRELAELEQRLEAARAELDELIFGDNRTAWIEHHIDVLRWPLERVTKELVEAEGTELDEVVGSASESHSRLSQLSRDGTAAGKESARRLKELEQGLEALLKRERAGREALERELAAAGERASAAEETLGRVRALAQEEEKRGGEVMDRLKQLSENAAAARKKLEQHRDRVREHRKAVDEEISQLGDAQANLLKASLGQDEREQLRARLAGLAEQLARARGQLEGQPPRVPAGAPDADVSSGGSSPPT